jgi:hypothetical protein
MSRETIFSLLPDVDVLLALAPEELAPILLRLAKENLQNGLLHPGNLATVTAGEGTTAFQRHNSYIRRLRDVELAFQEVLTKTRILTGRLR